MEDINNSRNTKAENVFELIARWKILTAVNSMNKNSESKRSDRTEQFVDSRIYSLLHRRQVIHPFVSNWHVQLMI